MNTKKLRLFGVIALAMVLIVSLSACGNGLLGDDLDLDNTAPTAEIIAPADDERISDTQTITGSAIDTNLASWSLNAIDHASAEDVEIEAGTHAVNDAAFVTDYDTTNLADGDWIIQLTVEDEAANITTTSVAVTVDNTAPTIETAITSEITAGSSVDVVFSEAIDADSQNWVEVAIDNPATVTLSYNWNADDDTVTVTNTSTDTDTDFGSSTVSSAIVTDLAGNEGTVNVIDIP